VRNTGASDVTSIFLMQFLTDGWRPAGHRYEKLKPFNSGCYGYGLSAMPVLVPVLSKV